MERLLTTLTASLTELRDTKKLREQAGDQPIAILNRNQVEGYFVPASAVDKISCEPAASGEAEAILKRRKSKIQPTLDYLKDK